MSNSIAGTYFGFLAVDNQRLFKILRRSKELFRPHDKVVENWHLESVLEFPSLLAQVKLLYLLSKVLKIWSHGEWKYGTS